MLQTTSTNAKAAAEAQDDVNQYKAHGKAKPESINRVRAMARVESNPNCILHPVFNPALLPEGTAAT